MAVEKPVEPGSDAREEEGPSGPLGADFLIPILSLALIAYYFVTTIGLAWEAKVTGVFIGAVLAPLCIAHMVRMILAASRGRATFGFGDLVDNTVFNRQRAGLVILMTAFIVAIPWIGTTLGLFLLLLSSMLLMGVRSVRILLGVSVVTTAIVYVLLIHLLNSRLPKGVIEGLIGSLLGGQ